MAENKNPYIGKIGNHGVQHVKVKSPEGGRGNKVIRGGDLRTRGGK